MGRAKSVIADCVTVGHSQEERNDRPIRPEYDVITALNGLVAQWSECCPVKAEVAGSNPVQTAFVFVVKQVNTQSSEGCAARFGSSNLPEDTYWRGSARCADCFETSQPARAAGFDSLSLR